MAMPVLGPSVLGRFRRDDRGNVAVLFGAVFVPLVFLMGGMVDLGRFSRYKTELANAVDAAALALAREGEDYTNAQATTFITNYVGAFGLEDSQFSITTLAATKTSTGFRVTADGAMNAIFLPIGRFLGNDSSSNSVLNMDIVAEVQTSSNRVELALVLDNTGSMNCGDVVSSYCTGNWNNPGSSSRIAGLKSAANKLIDVLMTPEARQNGYIKIGVVPFEGTVNIKNDSLDYSWLDWNDVGTAAGNGANFNDYNVDTSDDDCATTTTTGHWERQGWHWVWVDGGTTTTCTETAEKVGHKWLYDQLHAKNASVQWEGCVEMRASPYDMTDTVPTSANPDTLFVPFFWPDEPDDDNDNNNYYSNNYLDDHTSDNGSAAQRNTEKYVTSNVDWHYGKMDTSFPFESGPNYGCPRPILPLTTNLGAVQSAISTMVAYPAMGTYIPTGLAWGWRVLSPEAPFTEGIGPNDDNYASTVKAIVLLSDGENSVTSTSNHNKSIFSGYNYINTQVNGQYQLGSNDANTAETNLNSKTATLCENVKAAGIRLYTITFGDIPTSAKTLMENCATEDDGEKLYYHAPSNSELESIFYSIGEDLSEIHLSM